MLYLLLFSFSFSFAELPCDVNWKGEMPNKSSWERALDRFVDQGAGEDELDYYLKETKDWWKKTFPVHEHFKVKLNFNETPYVKFNGKAVYEIDIFSVPRDHPLNIIAGKLTGKVIAYSPQFELYRRFAPEKILEFKHLLIFSPNDFKYFTEARITNRLRDYFKNQLLDYKQAPHPNHYDFKNYLKILTQHFDQNNVKLKRDHLLAEEEFVFLPMKNGSYLNKLAYALDKKMKGAKLVYNPRALHERNASGMFSSHQNKVFISHESVVELNFDYVLIHEVMHAHFHNKMMEDMIFSPFVGEMRALNKNKLVGIEGYANYLSYEEVATHSLNTLMAGKNLLRESLYDHSKYLTSLKDLHSKHVMAIEITQAAIDSIEKAEQMISHLGLNSTLSRLRGLNHHGFELVLETDNYRAYVPFFLRQEDDQIVSIAKKYAFEQQVAKEDVILLRPYLKYIMQERLEIYQDILNAHKQALAKTEEALAMNYMGLSDEALYDYVKEVRNLSAKPRHIALKANKKEFDVEQDFFKEIKTAIPWIDDEQSLIRSQN